MSELSTIATPNYNTEIQYAVTHVTAKTGTGTLTVAEGGLIKVSAAADYTLTLPTAVGHTGLTYHFVKTDANYNLITLDGYGTETFNYPNDDGVPKETYPRLNTMGAEVTVVSDGANWQVINERLGQIPECLVYLSADQKDITNNLEYIYVDLDTEVFDIGSNFDNSIWVNSTATSTSAGHLVDSSAPFTPAMVNHRVQDITGGGFTYITAYNSATDVSVRDDIFASGDNYQILNSKFVVPISGKYLVNTALNYRYSSVVADKSYGENILVNGSNQLSIAQQAAFAGGIQLGAGSKILNLSVNDIVQLGVTHWAGVDTIDIRGGARFTWMQVKLVSKE